MAVIGVILLIGSLTENAFSFGPCDKDAAQFCQNVAAGGGRKIVCLKEHLSEVSAACKAALARYEGGSSGKPTGAADNAEGGDEHGSVSTLKNITVISRKGGRLDWSPQNVIAFDRLEQGIYNVYSMRPDGSDVKCLTCDRDVLGLPHKHVGQPAWHPSGRYLLVQAEKDAHAPAKTFYETTPGAGVFNDLWVLDVTARKAYRLVEVAAGNDHGVLHPHFSADGKRLSWTEQYRVPNLWNIPQQFGYFKIKVADFVFGSDAPRLEHVQEFQPDGEGFYENHGFSSDGSKLIFSHNGHGVSPFKNNIFTMDLSTGKLAQQLTTEGYNEHSLYSPDGSKIVWMTSLGITNKGTDFWLMDSDGSHKTRLTCFNEPGHPESTGKRTTASDSSWSPDGKQIAGYVQVGGLNNPKNSKDYEEQIVLMTLP